jgi:hypothetical protein
MKQVHEQAERNKGPIADVLDSLLPAKGLILEVASGSGQHVSYFARRFPHLMWQPSDPDPEARSSIMAYLEHSGLSNVRAPLDLDTTRGPWPIKRADAIVCINLVRSKSNGATLSLLERAAAILTGGHHLFLYGAYPEPEIHALQTAAASSFRLAKTTDMPDQSYTLIFERLGSSGQSGSMPRK